MTTNYLIGTSGWHYEHWRDTFYPPKLAELADTLDKIYTYFNNDVEGFALNNARTLLIYLQAE